MKLFHVRHSEEFYNTLARCQAPVYLTAQDGTKVSWQEFRRMVPQKAVPVLNEIEVTASCSEDVSRLIRFSMENRYS